MDYLFNYFAYTLRNETGRQSRMVNNNLEGGIHLVNTEENHDELQSEFMKFKPDTS
jgi:hypothetical protein